MRLLLYTANDQLVAIKTNAISAKIEEEINVYHQLTLELPLNQSNKDDILKSMYIAVATEQGDGFYMFKIEKVSFGDSLIDITAIERASDDLYTQGYIQDRRFQSSKLSVALDAIFSGSTWTYEVGTDTANETVNQDFNFYYVSRREALKKVLELYSLEFQFIYRITNGKITARVCKLTKALGRDTGYRFVYGSNALKVDFASDQTDLYTGAIGRGSGVEKTDESGEATGGYTRKIDFSSVVWTKASGNPVDKPSGQNFVELPEKTAKYGWTNSAGVKQPRLAIFEFDDEKDPAELLNKTYQQLLKLSEPQPTVKATVASLNRKINLGDNFSVVRYGDGWKLVYFLRVTKLTRDLLDDNATQIESGTESIKRQAEREVEATQATDSIKAEVDSSISDQEARARAMINNFNTKLTQRIDSTKSSIDKVLAQNSNGPITLIGQDGQPIAGVPEIKEIRSKDGSFLINSSGFKWGDHLMGGDSKIYADEIAGKTLDAYTINSTTINGGQIIGATISGQIYINSTSNPGLYAAGHERYAVISGDYGFTYTSAGGDGGRGSWIGLYSLGIGGVDLNFEQLRKIKEKCGV